MAISRWHGIALTANLHICAGPRSEGLQSPPFYICLEADVTLTKSAKSLRVSRNSMVVEISDPSACQLAFLECLRTPISEDRFDFLRDELRDDATDLLGLLLERGYLISFEAVSDTFAAFVLRHRRPPPTFFLGGSLDRPTTLDLCAFGKSTGTFTDLLRARSSAERATSIELNERILSHLLCHTYGPLRSQTISPAGNPTPAAGGIQSLLLFVHLADADSLLTYQYQPLVGSLEGVSRHHARIPNLCNEQATVNEARAQVTFAYDHTTNSPKYGSRGLDFALLEAGHAAQNLTLAATELGIGSRCIGSLSHPTLREVCNLAAHQIPIYATALF